ncbi:MAG: LapA family protein [Burkholderiales bacterium]
MNLRTLLLLLIVAAIAVFAALNWGAFTAPTTLSLGFGEMQAPLGLIMLAMTAVLALAFLVFVVYLQTTVLLEARRHARELQASRGLADQAEASRFTDLRGYVEAELARLASQGEASRASVLERLDEIERNLRTSVEQAGNTLAAYIGEIDDRIKRGGSDGPGA